MLKVLILIALLPLAEIALLIKLGQLTSLSTTILVVLATGFIGVLLARNQSFQIIKDIQWELNQGRIPGNHLIDGLLVLIGGLLLLAPGLITDTIGFLLIFNFTRIKLREYLKYKLKKWIDEGVVYVYLK